MGRIRAAGGTTLCNEIRRLYLEILGSNLGLTRETETFHEAHTYGSRSTSAMQAPGALVDGLAFTL